MADLMSLEKELQAVYGRQEGSRVYRTILPGILADFLRMREAAPAGALVREEYRLEDGRASVFLTARKGPGAAIEAELKRKFPGKLTEE